MLEYCHLAKLSLSNFDNDVFEKIIFKEFIFVLHFKETVPIKRGITEDLRELFAIWLYREFEFVAIFFSLVLD